MNEHNGWIPRDHWLEEWEKRTILDFYWEHPLDGDRRLTYKMLDANVVAISASSVYPMWQVVSGGGHAASTAHRTDHEKRVTVHEKLRVRWVSSPFESD